MRRILLVHLPCLSLLVRKIRYTIFHWFWPWLCEIIVLCWCSPGGEVALLWRKVCSILRFHQICWWSCYRSVCNLLCLAGVHSPRCAFLIVLWYQVSVVLSIWHVQDIVFCSIALWCWGAIWRGLGRVCLCTLFLEELPGKVWAACLYSAQFLHWAFSDLGLLEFRVVLVLFEDSQMLRKVLSYFFGFDACFFWLYVSRFSAWLSSLGHGIR